MTAPVIEIAAARARRGQAVPCDPRLGVEAPRRSAIRLVLGDALATVMLVLWLASVVLIFSALGRLAGDPGHVEPDDYRMGERHET